MEVMDWKAFLNQHNIPYVESGKNVARGNINVRCPFCSDDPSQHMGINMISGDWGCWRNNSHRGKRPHRLVMQLLSISYETAEREIGSFLESDLGEMEAIIRKLEGGDVEEEQVKTKLYIPADFKSLSQNIDKSSSRPFVNYLQDRGFGDDVEDVVNFYDIYYAISGVYSNRVILPIFEGETLVSWTGRHISKNEELRYKSASSREGAIKTVKQLIFQPLRIFRGGKALFVVEGPFDALKLDYYGKMHGVRTTCLFGTGYSADQLYYLRDIARLYEKVYISMDNGAEAIALDLLNDLADVPNISILSLTDFADDPGDLTKEQVDEICHTLI